MFVRSIEESMVIVMWNMQAAARDIVPGGSSPQQFVKSQLGLNWPINHGLLCSSTVVLVGVQ